MKSNQANSPHIPSQREDNDEIDLLALLELILEHKWLIVAAASLILVIAGIYAYFSTPIYRANTLIQVENNPNNSTSAMGEMAALFDVQSPASAEIEIIRSRLVIGRAADQLQLYIKAIPKYIPLIGQTLSKRAHSLSDPGIFGFGGYVSGNETITLKTFEVPKELEGKELELEVKKNKYVLYDPNGQIITEGKIGKDASFKYSGELGVINVIDVQGKEGARFRLTRTSRLEAITNLQKQLNISEKGKQSGMISATLEGTDPSRTARILNAIGAAYVRQNIERKAAEAEKSLAFLDTFLPQLKQQMQESEAQYTKFRDQHGTFNLGVEGEMSLQASAELQTRLLELQQKRREIAPRFQASHPAIKTIDQQIAAVQAELKKIDQNVRKMPDLEQQLLSLMRTVQVNSEMYVNLLNSAQQLRLVKEGKVGNVRVVDTAVPPEQAIAPKRALILMIGAIAGVLIGLALAFIRNWLRPGLSEPSPIESILGLHVFATIPHSEKQAHLHGLVSNKSYGQHVLANLNPQDPAIESLRSLRTALQFAMLEAKNNVVLLTGPTPGIGKSFTSVNFATILGSGGKRVLLIDADMRKGHLNQYFGLERAKGLSEIISGSIDLDESIHKSITQNVDFISTGIIPPNPGELLLSSAMATLLNVAAERYDLILLDTSPVLAVADALALARHAGTIFVVARANVTSIGEIDETVKRLQQAGAIANGVVFNDLSPSRHRYTSRYGIYRYAHYEYTTN